MKGIYCFTNKINGLKYIGMSEKIEVRYSQHLRGHLNPNHEGYKTKFYTALREYGFNTFDFEILTASDDYTVEDLVELERSYIAKFDSYYNGYNSQKGGMDTAVSRKLCDAVVVSIKDEIINSSKTFREIAKPYGLSDSFMSQLNKGEIWPGIGNYSYPLRKQTQNHQGDKNARAKFSDKEVMEMRQLFVETDLNSIYNLYQDRISFSALKKIIYGASFTHLPVYKKRDKKWILNGTCIDYPRLEEYLNY